MPSIRNTILLVALGVIIGLAIRISDISPQLLYGASLGGAVALYLLAVIYTRYISPAETRRRDRRIASARPTR
jgi:membrane associated rhomboid family serine protease